MRNSPSHLRSSLSRRQAETGGEEIRIVPRLVGGGPDLNILSDFANLLRIQIHHRTVQTTRLGSSVMDVGVELFRLVTRLIILFRILGC